MTSANVELVRSIYADWERGDFSSADWADPEIEYVGPDSPSPGSSTGLAGMAETFRAFLSAWDDFRVAADEFRELDDQRVLVLANLSGRGKTSRLDLGRLRTQGAHLFQLRDAKVVRLVQYLDSKRALADLGLTPEGGSPDS